MNSDTLQIGLPPANDRMLTTFFLAALFHGILILGVTFSASRTDDGDSGAPALEVVLVNDQAPKADRNPNARYIAQRTQLGTGNTLNGERTLIPDSSPPLPDQTGIPGGAGPGVLHSGESAGEDELVATRAPAVKILYFASPAVETASQMPELREKKPDFGMAPSDDGVELHLRGAAKRQLWIAADTRESDVAVYLDSWRRKIERIGTMNFPDAARRSKLSGTPVIEVTVGSGGKLVNAVIRRSSGHAEIDAAALRILKLAAPYDPFPAALNAKHDEIRIAYEWQFLGGTAQSSGVFYAAPGPSGAAR